jgi:anti-sigma-K factor RskA
MSEASPTDANLAFLYTSGEMDAAEKAHFEQRLAEEQPLREALCRAVELMQTLEGLAPLTPSPTYRQRVSERLRSADSLWRWLGQRRTYRGHPALWSGLGAAAALMSVLLMAPHWISKERPVPSDETMAKEQSPIRDADTSREVPAALSTIEVAETWASLPNTEHLTHAVEEENRRRDRRWMREEHLLHLPVPPTVRH